MVSPSADRLQPISTSADGSGEGEEARPEPYRQVVDAEECAAELDQTALEVAHMGLLVDHQPLDLMEHRRVRRVVVGAVGASRHDDADGRLLDQHRADLDRRGVGPEQQPFAVPALLEIERVVVLPGGMLGRDIERGEIVEVVLDIGPFGDREPHLAEDRHDFLDGLADGVDTALRAPAAAAARCRSPLRQGGRPAFRPGERRGGRLSPR